MKSSISSSSSSSLAEDLGHMSRLSRWSGAVYAPIMFLSALTTLPYLTIASLYINQRISEDLGLEEEQNATYQDGSSCQNHHDNTSSADDIANEVSRRTSHYTMLLSLANDIPAIFSICILGAVSDIKGRRIPVMASGIACVFRLAGFMITCAFTLPLEFLLVGELINGFGANHCTCVIMMSSAHITDSASPKRKNREMLYADIVFFTGSLISDLMTGFLIPYIHYFYLVSLLLITQCIILGYTMCFIPNFTLKREKNEQTVIQNIRQVVGGTLKVYFSKKETRLLHAQILGVLALIILHQIVYCGLYNTFLVYLLSAPLCWRSVMVGIYNAAHDVTFMVAGLACSAVCAGVAGSSPVQLILGLFSSMMFCVLVGVSSTTAMVYVSMLAGSFRVLVTPACRSMIGDLVPESQIGAAMAGIMSTWFICDLLGNVLFSNVYIATVDVYAGFVFFVAAAIYLFAFPISGWLIWLHRKFYRAENSSKTPGLAIIEDMEGANVIY